MARENSTYWEPITIYLLIFLFIFIGQRSDVISLRETAVDSRQYTTKPASQNKTERCFSASSHVMTDRRTMMDPEHLEELLLIRPHHKQNLFQAFKVQTESYTQICNRKRLQAFQVHIYFSLLLRSCDVICVMTL